MDRNGFSLVEMTTAVLILTMGILGMGATAGRMTTAAEAARVRSEALQAVEDQLSQIQMDPRYTLLDSLYVSTKAAIPGVVGLVRSVSITRTEKTVVGGGVIDYKEIYVLVDGPRLPEGLSRTLVVAAP
ncbi:MAG: hypothetical protein ACC667_09445 [Longimicrobiales bacterium]